MASRKITTEIETAELKQLWLIELAKLDMTQGQFLTKVIKNFLISKGVIKNDSK